MLRHRSSPTGMSMSVVTIPENPIPRGMFHLAPRRTLFARFASWYFQRCSFQRGKGHLNRFFGRFLKVPIPGGASVRLTSPMEYVQAILLSGRIYEPQETCLLFSALKPGMIFFDVGANLGYYTLL